MNMVEETIKDWINNFRNRRIVKRERLHYVDRDERQILSRMIDRQFELERELAAIERLRRKVEELKDRRRAMIVTEASQTSIAYMDSRITRLINDITQREIRYRAHLAEYERLRGYLIGDLDQMHGAITQAQRDNLTREFIQNNGTTPNEIEEDERPLGTQISVVEDENQGTQVQIVEDENLGTQIPVVEDKVPEIPLSNPGNRTAYKRYLRGERRGMLMSLYGSGMFVCCVSLAAEYVMNNQHIFEMLHNGQFEAAANELLSQIDQYYTPVAGLDSPIGFMVEVLGAVVAIPFIRAGLRRFNQNHIALDEEEDRIISEINPNNTPRQR